jgi:glycosyltransferase involved in cell wall biosynthesis
MAVLEALASSTAVLLTPGCNFPESERAGAGRVVRNDVASLTEGLRALLSRPDELRQMGRRGVRLVNDNYTWNRIADSLLEAYAEGVARYRSNLTPIGAR